MEKLLEVLKDVCPDVEFEKETALVDEGILSSFDVLTIVSEISDAFDVSLRAEDILPENFNSLEAMWALIQSRQ